MEVEGVILACSGGFGTVEVGWDGQWVKSGLTGIVYLTPAKVGWAFSPPVKMASGPEKRIDFKGRVTCPVRQITRGDGHFVALKDDGTVWAWGGNACGALGNASNKDQKFPIGVFLPYDVIAVAAGDGFGVALRRDGSVWTWGRNDYGQLGDEYCSESSRWVPSRNSISRVTAIDAGRHHALALKDDGTVWAWGGNASGQLGNARTDQSARPVMAVRLEGVIAIAAGHEHSLALRQDGTV